MSSLNIGVDFDGVVMDTGRSMKLFKETIVKNGVPQEVLDAYYKDPEVHPEYMSRSYTLVTHSDIALKKLGEHGPSAVRTAWDLIKPRMKDYIFLDAWAFMEIFKKENTHLVTHGGDGWQNLRLDLSEVRRYFQHILITNGITKAQALIKYFGEEGLTSWNGFYLDDKLSHLEDVKKIMPNIITIWVDRKKSKVSGSDLGRFDHRVVNLTEATRIIRGLSATA